MATTLTDAGRPSPIRAWVLAIRPQTLSAGAIPVAVGTAVAAADGVLAWGPALAALVGALLIQIGCNLANDLFDFKKGADGEDRLGPPRAAQQGWLGACQIAVGTAVALGAAVLVGLYLVAVGGIPIVVIGVASVVCALAYTGGPWPLGYHGLGDVFVLAFFGPVAVGGTYWVQAGALPAAPLWASLSVGLLATAILVVNNLRDRHSDARAGKRTLAVRLGATGARIEHTSLIVLAYLVPVIAWATGAVSWGWLLPLVSAPLAAARVRAVWTKDGAALNPELGGTARLGLLFGVLLCVGVLL